MSYVDYPYENQLLCEENKQLRAEINEQARLLGISAEKELALRAENERLKAENELYAAEMSAAKEDGFYSAQELFMAYHNAEEELAEAKKDAERYRWLRNNPVWVGYDSDFRPDEIDAAIDAAMKGK